MSGTDATTTTEPATTGPETSTTAATSEPTTSGETTSTATTQEAITDATTAASSTTTGASATTEAECAAEATDECTGCMREACCEALADCQADAACVACVSGEDGDACESTPETHARVDAYLECKGAACQEVCIGGPVGSCEDALAELAQDACTTCLGASCCEEVAACHGNSVCWTGCFTVHDDAVCHSDPDGHALYHALGACASGSCQAECF
ncbi:hypothetical protein SAMN02745121_00068 [Nannocystis exedens]|uniref:Uncharacterized protein n=1 Tax=Nannocystis exedens TaxID=54 RepID=A0A1I1SIY8_9BACT|nr:hypothetical protein NAEX_08639 [Nannocystis exedens]SFD46457.1 hypothetical protein SAMN02745121_00068 [Nannocystis exedens]